MSEPNLDDQLQQYFDGELPPEEADALRDQIDSDEELQAKLEGLNQLRTLLRAALAPEHLETPDGDALFAAIEGALDDDEDEQEPAPETAPRPEFRVLDGGKPAEVPATPVEPPSRSPIWLGVGGLALAAAAALLFIVLRPTDPPAGTDGDPTPLAALPPPGSEIEEIDFGHSTGAIFQVEDEGAQYAVVWISDEKPPDLTEPSNPDEDEDRMQ